VSRYRTGNKNPRNIYLVDDDGHEVHVGVMFDPLDGPRTARALNQVINVAPETNAAPGFGAAQSESATVIVVGPSGTWVYVNARADLSTEAVYEPGGGLVAPPRVLGHDFTISGICDFVTWTAASRRDVNESLVNHPTDQKEG